MQTWRLPCDLLIQRLVLALELVVSAIPWLALVFASMGSDLQTGASTWRNSSIFQMALVCILPSACSGRSYRHSWMPTLVYRRWFVCRWYWYLTPNWYLSVNCTLFLGVIRRWFGICLLEWISGAVKSQHIHEDPILQARWTNHASFTANCKSIDQI